MDKQIYQQRVRAVRGLLKDRKLDGLIVTSPANVRYLTGFTGDDSWALVVGRSVYLVTDSRYTEQAAKDKLHCKVHERKGAMTRAVGPLIAKVKSAKVIGVDGACTLTWFEKLRKDCDVKFKPVPHVFESIRRTKDAQEVELIRQAADLGWKALSEAMAHLEPGITEAHLAGQLELEIRRLEAVPSFETIVAFGANASQPHYIPGHRRLRKYDTILIDMGVKKNGYCSDVTRCFAFGRCRRFYERAYTAVLEAKQAAMYAVADGAEIAAVDKAAKEVLAGYGLPEYGHGTGHGLGMEVHESPIVSYRSEGRLQAGDVITIEPGVYIPGKVGIRLEDDVLVTEKGAKLLSKDKRYGFSSEALWVLT